jgi:hypothetical protein
MLKTSEPDRKLMEENNVDCIIQKSLSYGNVSSIKTIGTFNMKTNSIILYRVLQLAPQIPVS